MTHHSVNLTVTQPYASVVCYCLIERANISNNDEDNLSYETATLFSLPDSPKPSNHKSERRRPNTCIKKEEELAELKAKKIKPSGDGPQIIAGGKSG